MKYEESLLLAENIFQIRNISMWLCFCQCGSRWCLGWTHPSYHLSCNAYRASLKLFNKKLPNFSQWNIFSVLRCLVLLVKILNSMMKDKMAEFIKTTFNSDLPYVPWLTGYGNKVTFMYLNWLIESFQLSCHGCWCNHYLLSSIIICVHIHSNSSCRDRNFFNWKGLCFNFGSQHW